MRRVWITKTGGPEVLQVREEPDPEAKAGEVRIRTHAAGINFADLVARIGLYPDAPPIPCVVGYEISGVVDQVGEGVDGLAVGDRVFGMPKFGGYTDTIALSAKQVFKLPDEMSFEEAAALPVTYVTAYHMMFQIGAVHEGSSILIHSAAGGVGTAAIQLAKTRNCVILGIASASKHDFLRELGVAHPIDGNADYEVEVRKIVGDEGVDLILDPVGGESWTKGYRLLAPCGRLACFGLSSATPSNKRKLLSALGAVLSIKKWNPRQLMDDNKAISGTNMGHLFHKVDLLRREFDALLALYREKRIAPLVDKTFPFAEAAAAHQYIHDRKAKGKVLLTP